MDERERDYLRQQLQDLERSRRRWKTAAVSLLVGFALFLIVGTGALLTHGLFTQRLQMEEVMRQAEQARFMEQQARQQAEEAAAQARQAEALLKQAADKAGKKSASGKGTAAPAASPTRP